MENDLTEGGIYDTEVRTRNEKGEYEYQKLIKELGKRKRRQES